MGSLKTMPKMICDFCGYPNPKFQFRNPAIHSRFVTYEEGHLAACADCAMLLEDGNLSQLVVLALRRHSIGEYELLADELMRVYMQVSRVRESL